MRILVTGAGGQLGRDVMKEIAARDYEGVGTDIAAALQECEAAQDSAEPPQEDAEPPQEGSAAPQVSAVTSEGNPRETAMISEGNPRETVDAADGISYIAMDITDRDEVREVITRVRPDVVIHCAAWTAVDAAEEPENREKVDAINAKGTRYVAEAAKETGAAMIYLSTDYVFSGQGTEPWKPDAEDYAPLNVYGKSKLEGELAVKELLDRYYIVRIAWVFGEHGNNFVRTMLRLGRGHETLRVVCDQIGTPTYTPDLARLLIDMAQTDRYGYYHATNEGGFISWYDFAREIFRQAGYDTKVIPVTTREYGLSKAERPFNSRLDKSKLSENGFTRLPDWRDALRRYLAATEH